uniref:Uncharacterized protein n=1 Tax=Quercus lobata TaxID=97700 RepID=A0A7N2QYY2_QUELO
MEYTKLNVNDQDENGKGRNALSVTNNVPTLGGTTIDWSKWKLNCIGPSYECNLCLTFSLVETLKCGLSLLALARLWRSEGVTEDNRLSTTFDEVIVTHSCITLPSKKSGQGMPRGY